MLKWLWPDIIGRPYEWLEEALASDELYLVGDNILPQDTTNLMQMTLPVTHTVSLLSPNQFKMCYFPWKRDKWPEFCWKLTKELHQSCSRCIHITLHNVDVTHVMWLSFDLWHVFCGLGMSWDVIWTYTWWLREV